MITDDDKACFDRDRPVISWASATASVCYAEDKTLSPFGVLIGQGANFLKIGNKPGQSLEQWLADPRCKDMKGHLMNIVNGALFEGGAIVTFPAPADSGPQTVTIEVYPQRKSPWVAYTFALTIQDGKMEIDSFVGMRHEA